uniref:GPI transamidase component PIG-T n=1 Tax=Macrostomum lignano TaxID=282301 RepID=A0A1I8FXD6_9PLAT
HKHFSLFPRSISDLAARFRVSEFHLTLSQGYWNHAAWGYASQPQPQGAELWAWLGSHGSESDKVESNWREFVSAVSGMFCASVNAMATGAVATSPAWSYRPEGLSQRGREPRTLRLAQIVNQGVCTENLTPWSRLLPCKKQAGIGHRAVSLPCSLATSQTGSRLLVLKRTAPDPDQSAVQPEPLQSYNLANGLKLLDYNLTKMLDDEAKDSVDVKFNFPWTWVPVERLQSPPVVAQKYQIGTGSEMGGVVVAISNRHPSQAINVIILEIVPWQLRMLFHTLELTLGDNLAHKANKVHYQQSVDRVRPAKLELLVTVPPRTSLRVSYRFTKQLVRWNEFPPDANHGLYLPPTVVSFVAPSDSSLRLPVLPQTVLSIAELTANRNATTPEPIFVRLYTEALLVNAPKPDFSMPYNVLCLVCTVLAIGSGFMHNVACKLASVSNPNPADKDATLIGRLKKMLTPWRRQ